MLPLFYVFLHTFSITYSIDFCVDRFNDIEDKMFMMDSNIEQNLWSITVRHQGEKCSYPSLLPAFILLFTAIYYREDTSDFMVFCLLCFLLESKLLLLQKSEL